MHLKSPSLKANSVIEASMRRQARTVVGDTKLPQPSFSRSQRGHSPSVFTQEANRTKLNNNSPNKEEEKQIGINKNRVLRILETFLKSFFNYKLPQSTISQFVSQIKELINNIKRYGVEITNPSEIYDDFWMNWFTFKRLFVEINGDDEAPRVAAFCKDQLLKSEQSMQKIGKSLQSKKASDNFALLFEQFEQISEILDDDIYAVPKPLLKLQQGLHTVFRPVFGSSPNYVYSIQCIERIKASIDQLNSLQDVHDQIDLDFDQVEEKMRINFPQSLKEQPKPVKTRGKSVPREVSKPKPKPKMSEPKYEPVRINLVPPKRKSTIRSVTPPKARIAMRTFLQDSTAQKLTKQSNAIKNVKETVKSNVNEESDRSYKGDSRDESRSNRSNRKSDISQSTNRSNQHKSERQQYSTGLKHRNSDILKRRTVTTYSDSLDSGEDSPQRNARSKIDGAETRKLRNQRSTGNAPEIRRHVRSSANKGDETLKDKSIQMILDQPHKRVRRSLINLSKTKSSSSSEPESPKKSNAHIRKSEINNEMIIENRNKTTRNDESRTRRRHHSQKGNEEPENSDSLSSSSTPNKHNEHPVQPIVEEHTPHQSSESENEQMKKPKSQSSRSSKPETISIFDSNSSKSEIAPESTEEQSTITTNLKENIVIKQIEVSKVERDSSNVSSPQNNSNSQPFNEISTGLNSSDYTDE